MVISANGANNSSRLWCPESYQLMEINGQAFKLCRPTSCVEVPKSAKNMAGKRLQCQKFTNAFRQCQKVYSDIGQYVVGDDNGTLWNQQSNNLPTL